MPAVRSLRSAAAALLVLAAACGDDDGPKTGAEAFCAQVAEAEPEMLPVTDPASASTTAALFARLGPAAPEEIRPQWNQLTDVFRTIAALDPADPGIRETVLAETGRTITAAAEVNAWIQQRCGIDLTAATQTTLPATTAPAPTSPAPAPDATASTVPVVPVTSAPG